MSAPGDNLPLVTGMLEALTDRVRAEREGRLRAEARVRALEEALGEALEALREPRAEKALVEVEAICDGWMEEGEYATSVGGGLVSSDHGAVLATREDCAVAISAILTRLGFGKFAA